MITYWSEIFNEPPHTYAYTNILGDDQDAFFRSRTRIRTYLSWRGKYALNEAGLCSRQFKY